MNTFISNAAVLQAFGIKDHYSTDYISKVLGDTTRSKNTYSYSSGINTASNTESSQTFARRLRTPDEVETSQGIITIIDGLRKEIPKLPLLQKP
jgi:type IV secretory pathway TraG/TraD family ATPase VirD4